jgi:hypothetical protein
VRLSSSILTTEVSVMMVWDLSAFGVEARRIRPKKGH